MASFLTFHQPDAATLVGGSFNVQTVSDLAIAPSLKSAINTNLPLFRTNHTVSGEKGWSMTYMQSNGIAIQGGCNDCKPNPIGNVSAKTRTLTTCCFNIHDEICLNTAVQGCTDYLSGYEIDGEPTDTEIGQAMFTGYWKLKENDVVDNIAAITWLGNTRYVRDDFNNASPVSLNTAQSVFADRAHSLLSYCNGFFADIQCTEGGDMIASDDLHQYHNDQLPDGEWINEFFYSLKNGTNNNSKRITKRLPRNQAAFYVTQSFYDRYYDYLLACFKNIPQGYMLQVEGVTATVNGNPVLLWRGIPVYWMCEWDDLLCRYLGYDTAHVAIYSANGNLAIGSDIQAWRIAGNGNAVSSDMNYVGPMLKIHRGTGRDHKVLFMDGKFRLGTKVAQPELLTAAFSFNLCKN